MQADARVAKEQAVSTQLQRQLHDAKQQLSQVCWTAPACMEFVIAVVLMNAKRCLITAIISVQSRCRTVTKHIFCCCQDQCQDSNYALLQSSHKTALLCIQRASISC